ncbi:MAG: hypothetical protein BZY79_01405 [SAR202 cluster bacterium Casp-Chloro-G4]|nr:PfkB family carbohydrate kinase [Chloroflexota bacterium]MDA1227659.1 PfkB family carbohydrate kinase [Chloroflexota bacterium]PKB61897.1 MAG: hypothetical protein BZY79_01405 [SAR202 cluster bacterium Casp-Chloro-G4]
MRPDFLAIGHAPKDLTPDGLQLGGAVTYGAIAAKRLGVSPAVVTSVGPDVEVADSLPDIPVHVVPSAQTTTFVNTYIAGRRTQFIRAVAGPISTSDIPQDWTSAPLVMLGPLAQELDSALASHFPESIVVASIQGWLRQWDEDGRVSPCQWNGYDILPHVDAVILSIDDIEDSSMLDGWKDLTPVLIITRGSEGADVHFQGTWHHVESFPVTEVDPTGAGDVFAAAYLVRFSETRDVLLSARFASCAASFCVARQGTQGIPYRADVEARLAGDSA